MFVYMCVALLFDCVHCKTKNEEKSEKLNAIIKKLEKGIKFNPKKISNFFSVNDRKMGLPLFDRYFLALHAYLVC